MTRVLVTGAGRSGTHWVAQCLRETGIAATHEQAFTPHRHGDAFWEAEVSWPAAAYLPVAGNDVRVVHLVRNPLFVVASLVARGTFADTPTTWGKWAADTCPEIAMGSTTMERAALYWVAWNRMVHGHADLTLRIDRIDPNHITMMARTVDPSARPSLVLPPRVDATDPPPQAPSWEEVEYVPGLVGLAERYGYL